MDTPLFVWVLWFLSFFVGLFYSTVTYPLAGFTLETPGLLYDGGFYFVHHDAPNGTVYLLNPLRRLSGSWEYSIAFQSYNFISKTWTDHAPHATGLVYFGTWTQSFTSIGSILYFVDTKGEFGTVDIATLTVQFPHPHISTFYPLTADPCLTTDGRYVFVIGGEDTINKPKKEQNWFQIYDTLNSQWLNAMDSNIPRLNRERKAETCEYYDQYLYVFGGSSISGLTDTIEFLFVGTGGDQLLSTVVSQSWVLSNYTISPLCRYSSTIMCGERFIYIFGGRYLSGDDYTIYDNVQVFDTTTKELIHAPFTMNVPRMGQRTICTGDYIYVAFGFDNGKQDLEMQQTWEKSNILIASDNQTHAPSDITDVPTNSPSNIATNAPSDVFSNTPTIPPAYIPPRVSSVITTIDPSTIPTSIPTDVSIDIRTTHSSDMQPTNINTDRIITSLTTDGDFSDQQDDTKTGLVFIVVGLCLIVICAAGVLYFRGRKRVSIAKSSLELQGYVTSQSNKTEAPQLQQEKSKEAYKGEGNHLSAGGVPKKDRASSEGMEYPDDAVTQMDYDEEGVVQQTTDSVLNVKAIMDGSAVMTSDRRAKNIVDVMQDVEEDSRDEDISQSSELYDQHQ
eukprot:347435_1